MLVTRQLPPDFFAVWFFKVFERIVCRRFSAHLSKLLTTQQHGFVRGRSVETNLCSFLTHVSPVVSNRGQVDCIYFDLSKAFDRVHHELLIRKLKGYGFCPALCKWMFSYLSTRQNYVHVHDILSIPFVSTSGVPQGSVLGPLFVATVRQRPSL